MKNINSSCCRKLPIAWKFWIFCYRSIIRVPFYTESSALKFIWAKEICKSQKSLTGIIYIKICTSLFKEIIWKTTSYSVLAALLRRCQSLQKVRKSWNYSSHRPQKTCENRFCRWSCLHLPLIWVTWSWCIQTTNTTNFAVRWVIWSALRVSERTCCTISQRLSRVKGQSSTRLCRREKRLFRPPLTPPNLGGETGTHGRRVSGDGERIGEGFLSPLFWGIRWKNRAVGWKGGGVD